MFRGGLIGRCSISVKQSNDDQQSLAGLMSRWKVAVEEEDSFRDSVWSEIERTESASGISIWENLRAGFERFFSSTTATISAGLSMVTLSLGAAHLHVQSTEEENRNLAEINYLEAIYPVFSPTPSAP